MSPPRKTKAAPPPAGTASREPGGPYLAAESAVELLDLSRKNPPLFLVVVAKLLSPAFVGAAEEQLGLAVADRLRQLINSESPLLLSARRKEPECPAIVH